MKQIIETLKIERIKLDKTQLEMDEYINVGKGTTQRLEAGKILNCRTIERYGDKLNMELRWFTKSSLGS